MTTKQHRQERVKPTKIPEKPWDNRCRFRRTIPGWALQPCCDSQVKQDILKLPEPVQHRFHQQKKSSRPYLPPMGLRDNWKVTTDHHSTPKISKNLQKPRDFTTIVTPGHARANGEAESFMKLLNKSEKIAHIQGRNSKIAIQDMLTGFPINTTPGNRDNTIRSPHEQTRKNQARPPNQSN